MKVAILVSGLPPAYNGGAEIAALKLAESAARMGHEMHIVTMGYCPESAGGVSIHRVPAANTHYVRSLSFIPGMLAVLASVNPDVIHAQSAYMTPGAIVANAVLGKPYIFYERGGVDMNLGIYRYLYPLAMRRAQRVVAQTESQKRSLLKYCRRRVEVIPNGIDRGIYCGITKEEARRTLGLPMERKLVLSVGRCRPEKNIMGFVQATAKITDALCIVIGDGPQLKALRALSRENLVFAGGMSNDRVQLYMRAGDVLVNTSFSEGFPMSILEGMMYGLPIVAPAICGIPEILRDNVNGILSLPNDPESTFRGIRKILDNETLAQYIGKANQEAVKNYTWENVVRRLYR